MKNWPVFACYAAKVGYRGRGLLGIRDVLDQIWDAALTALPKLAQLTSSSQQAQNRTLLLKQDVYSDSTAADEAGCDGRRES